MGSDYFLNSVNQTIGENMRFARQFQANPQAASTQASNTDALSAMINPLLLMMLFQMMGQLTGQAGNMPQPPYAPPPPIPPDSYVNNGVPLQNPAYQFINNRLTGVGATTMPPSVNFEDNVSIQRRIDSILSVSNDATITALANQLKTISPTSDQAVQIHAQIDAQLAQGGRSAEDIQEYDLLWQAAQDNHRLQELRIVSVGTPSQTTTDTINQLQQDRADLANQWTDYYGGVNAVDDADNPVDLTTSVRNALQQGQFSEAQLGQSLKYMLDKAPDTIAGQVTGVVSDLMETGELNINPFLTSDYLERLTPDRRQALLDAVESSGLRMANGQPNSRFIGFMLEQLGRPADSTTKRFLQQFLQDFYAAYGSEPDTPVGSTLAMILNLAGVQPDADGQLVFA